MPLRLKMWHELGEIRKHAKPAHAGLSPDPPKEPQSKFSRTSKIIIKFLTYYSLIAALITIIGIHTVFSFFNLLSNRSFDTLEKYHLYDPQSNDQTLLASNMIEEEDIPASYILSPKEGERTSHFIQIKGVTHSIPQDHHVVLTVDAEMNCVCFPKWPIIESNILFRSDIYEGGPKGDYAITLFKGEGYRVKIMEWL